MVPTLTPFRPWKFKDPSTADISAFLNPERNQDDRSRFVRYARAAAQWAEWVREEFVVIEPTSQMPTLQLDGQTFTYAIAPVEQLLATISVPPSAKDHHQRLLEATQVYVEPIIVVEDGNRFTVVGNHELFAAAVAYQKELARPNRQRSSDLCLVAVVNPSYIATVQTNPLTFETDQSPDAIKTGLEELGYAVSPRTDDLSTTKVHVDGEIWSNAPQPGKDWKDALSRVLGIKSLDFRSNETTTSTQTEKTRITLLSPQLSRNVQQIGMEFPYSALTSTIVPIPGANMWSLRDFRAG